MLRIHNGRVNGIQYLITKSLGYCCEWKFFSLFSDCELIAARLGVTDRGVRKHKARFVAGSMQCERCSNCQRAAQPRKPV